MAKSITPWLGDFLAAELQAAVSWKEALTAAPKIKQDPDCRFSDDGSNLRSLVTEQQLVGASKVQLLRVVSASSPAVVVISDGATSISCILSENAVRKLEDEFEAKLALDHKGDILSLRAFTVISTPFGPLDRQIQFFIDDLRYEYSLRKVIGKSQSAQINRVIAPLLNRVRELWDQRYMDAAEEYDADHDVSTSASPGRVAGVPSPRNGQREQRPISDPTKSNPRSQHASTSKSSPRTNGIEHTQTQLRAATQVLPTLRRNAGPSLARDGFEVAAGVNLAQPQGAAVPSVKVAKAPPVAVRTDVLNLLLPQQSAKSGAQSSTNEQTEILPRRPPSTNARKPTPASELEISPVVAITQEPRSSTKRKRSSTREQAPVPCGRRNIPKPQRDLLEKESSWYPALPGRQFPCPNVPIELLKIWNANVPQAAIEASQRSQAVRQTQSSQASQQHSKPAHGSSDASASDSESSEDSDIPYEWDPSPVAQRHVEALPEDSSAPSPSIQQPAIHQGLERPEPRANPPTQQNAKMPYNAASGQSIGYRRHRYNGSASNASQRSYDGNRPDRSSTKRMERRSQSPGSTKSRHFAPEDSSGRFSRPNSRPSSSATTSQAGSLIKPVTPSSGKRLSGGPQPPPGGRSDSYRNSSRPAARIRDFRDDARYTTGAHMQQLPIRSPDKADSAATRQPPLRSSGTETVIKGTQFSGRGDDMEMDVPRPLGDRVQAHRQRRREYLGGAQRRKW
ncbi:Shelterin complex subunit, TPP1/ACD [Teratosphaeria destructans]|uniref:Shelterin complex subunit, TPP1/ACD n=1 Tax=Teratosphaeria destructans TaxID=418781 RepID=A0A9W7SM29_9PEZI|nr:Shelterin complex subunit, TPP1/ACD [Teratosphaeria destructans]